MERETNTFLSYMNKKMGHWNQWDEDWVWNLTFVTYKLLDLVFLIIIKCGH